MNSGSMLITNYLNEKTLLKVSGNSATSDPEDNALNDARAALNLEKTSRSPNLGNIAFLTHWIRLYQMIPSAYKASSVKEESSWSGPISSFGPPADKEYNFSPNLPSEQAKVQFGKPSWEK